MGVDAKITSLGAVATVRAGYPFRGAIRESRTGGVLAVQMKDVDAGAGVRWEKVSRVDLTGRGQADWLREGDLVFVARGTRFYAAALGELPERAVCGPHLYHLRVRTDQPLLPRFLAWQINQAPFQRKLARSAEGSSQLSVRRPVLETLAIALPTIEKQRHIVAFAELVRQESLVYEELMLNRQRQLRAIAEGISRSDLLPPPPTLPLSTP